MKRILISGGAGFIGSHLCERLLKEGNDVICIDNYFTGHKSNIRHLLKHPNFEVIRHDIVYPYMAEVEEIYNLACPASPIYYQHDPIKTTQTSVIGAMNMLAIANRNHAKILQASTSEVYGDPLIHPQPEDYWGHVNPLGLRSCYDEGKRCAESLFMSYYREHGVPVKIVRIFNTYGPKMDINDGRVVSNFIVQALRGQTTMDEAVRLIQQRSRNYAKRQLTWFRRNPDIIWLDMQGDAYAQACDEIEKFLKQAD